MPFVPNLNAAPWQPNFVFSPLSGLLTTNENNTGPIPTSELSLYPRHQGVYLTLRYAGNGTSPGKLHLVDAETRQARVVQANLTTVRWSRVQFVSHDDMIALEASPSIQGRSWSRTSRSSASSLAIASAVDTRGPLAMPLLDRHRVDKLIALTDLERTVAGPERLLREPDVATLIKAAYDDAEDTARGAFMARVQKMPTSAWPWSAVQAPPPAARPPRDVRPRGGGGIGTIGVPRRRWCRPRRPCSSSCGGRPTSPTPTLAISSPPGARPRGPAWEGLQSALDRWDTAEIRRYIRPQGWTVPGAEGPRESQDDGATSGAPAPAPGGTSPGLPATQPAAVPLWKQPAVLVASATALVATGVTVYALTRDSASRRLEAELERQAGEARKQ
ncbi:hypothetical protein [Nannocystis sp.]|uniref:hypothetical protein n=1 Tax=Nannocystis sp. TaxID=1962667 RepID=UPI0025D3959F|nr:hypothetical protein [Nannocystis sp.]MBK7829614.1 hypothetical protein [Nannocystis sp.]